MAALAGVAHSDSGRDVVASGHVQNLEVEEGGEVRFAFLLQPEDPSDLVKAARSAVEAVAGVTSVKVNLQLPQMGAVGGGGRQGGLRPGSVPAPTPKPDILSGVRHVIAVSSGKGGVGKSMVAANLAAAFAKKGMAVGLLDADIYGPNIPLMFGEERRPRVVGDQGREMIEPLESQGVKLMSLGFLLDKEQPAIMRGPLITGILKQFLEQVAWGALDLMVVDMPPRSRRRPALPGSVHRHRGCGDGHHAPGCRYGRRPPGSQDVRAREHPGARRRGEHERHVLSPLR